MNAAAARPGIQLLAGLDAEARRLVEAAAATGQEDAPTWLERRVMDMAAAPASLVEVESAPLAEPRPTPLPRRRRPSPAAVAARIAAGIRPAAAAAGAAGLALRRGTVAAIAGSGARVAAARRRWGDKRLALFAGGAGLLVAALAARFLAPAPGVPVTASVGSPGAERPAASAPAPATTPATAPATTPAPTGGTRPPATAAADVLRHRAERGDSMAAHDLGVLYADGRNIPRDYAEAARWFRRAAMGGVANAQFNLAVLLERGLGVDEDMVDAARLYRTAAEQGHAGAQYNLGIVLAEGRGVTQDYADAARWFRRAADQGFAKAAYNLGVLYERGFLGTVDDVEAYRWYARALESGDGDAKERMEVIARRLTPQDLVLARQRPTGSADPAVVAEVQRLLTARGYKPGSPDGNLGEKTAEAIRRFQAENGLQEDGQPTVELLQRLGGSAPAR
ncbi:MAG: peptidoglycan-binding protein [Alphaproteobacteria bacterium]